MRYYQKQIISDIYAKLQRFQNVCMQLSTGGGKTHIFCKIISEHPGKSLVIAHRNELLTQISLTLALRGVRHAITGQRQMIKDSIALHMSDCGKSFYDPGARVTVVGVDTLTRMSARDFKDISLIVQDEAHHVLKKNKWGFAAAMFPNAKGIYPTATPCRADGKGLGRHADGLFDALVIGPSMRDLINDGYLSDYRVFSPPSDLDLSHVTVTPGGDYSPPQLRNAVHKSRITGDVVAHYLRLAAGKRGITFAVDIKAAEEIADEYKKQGVNAEVVSSKTPTLLRAHIMRRFRTGELLQLVNVDLLGEGVDVPAVEVVSMARPTESYSLYAQQFGRALRPLPGKSHAIIIDHVGNVMRHRLPDDINRTWTLDRRERRTRGKPTGVMPIRTCLACYQVYSKLMSACPYCGATWTPAERSNPDRVDGDLTELDPATLVRLRGEIDRISGAPQVPTYLDHIAQRGFINRHRERQHAQQALRAMIAQWAGVYKHQHGDTDSQLYKRFYCTFDIDVMTAQTLGANDATQLMLKIKEVFDERK